MPKQERANHVLDPPLKDVICANPPRSSRELNERMLLARGRSGAGFPGEATGSGVGAIEDEGLINDEIVRPPALGSKGFPVSGKVPWGIGAKFKKLLDKSSPVRIPYSCMVKRSTDNSGNQQRQNDLTDTQAEILDFIRKTCELTSGSPSYREIQEHFGYKAIGTVQDHVKALLAKGYLEKGTGKSRRARGLLPSGFRPEGVRQIPIYGEIAAGATRDSPQIELGSLTLPHSMLKGECFALRVVGDSMQDVGILEGDLLVVQKQNRARTGDIVVALLNRETTVKRYVESNGQIQLVPENKKMKPIPVTTEDFQIQGKVIGLQRRF